MNTENKTNTKTSTKEVDNVIMIAINKARKVAKSRNMPYSAEEIGNAIGVPSRTIYSFLKSQSPNSAIASKIFKLYDIKCVITL